MDATSVSKRKRSQRDLVPKLNSKPTVSDNEVTSTKRGPQYYTLIHAKSVHLFYLHTSDCTKELEVIESEIQSEFETSSENDVQQPNLNAIYGYYSSKQNKYYRVRVIKPIERNNEKDDQLFEVFYLDYGYVENVDTHDLFRVADTVQQFAPQAICCKLHGFEEGKNSHLDQDESKKLF